MRGKISVLTFAFGLIAVGCCLCPAEALADVHLAFGTRWDPLRYTTPALQGGTGLSAPMGTKVPPVGSDSGLQATSLDPYFAVYFAQKYGVMLSLDIGYGKYAVTLPSMAEQDNSFVQFGFSLGFKMYITQPRRERVAPYIYADFYKYFSSVSSDNSTTDLANFYAGLVSPIGGTFAFGAEYFVTPAFSIGSEVLGIRVGNVSSDYNVMSTKTNVAYTFLTFYTGISLNFRFQVATSVSASEASEANEEEEKPAKQKKAPKQEPTEATPPPTPPPPTPEAVD